MTFKGVEEVSGLCIPDANSIILRTRCQERAIRRPIDAIDIISMTLKGVEEVSGLCIPDANSIILRTRCKMYAIGRPVDAIDIISMTLKGVEEVSNGGIPEVNSIISRGRGQERAIKRPGYLPNTFFVSMEHTLQCNMPSSAFRHGSLLLVNFFFHISSPPIERIDEWDMFACCA
jgi:hypothetical protein